MFLKNKIFLLQTHHPSQARERQNYRQKGHNKMFHSFCVDNNTWRWVYINNMFATFCICHIPDALFIVYQSDQLPQFISAVLSTPWTKHRTFPDILLTTSFMSFFKISYLVCKKFIFIIQFSIMLIRWKHFLHKFDLFFTLTYVALCEFFFLKKRRRMQ